MIVINNIHNFYTEISSDARAAIDKIAQLRSAKKGSHICRAGDPCVNLFQILHGAAKISTCNPQGRESVTSLITDGDWFLVSEMFSGLPAISDVIALSNVELRVIAYADFSPLLDSHPDISRQLLRILSLRFSFLYYQGIDRSILTLKERVIKTLYAQILGASASNSAEVMLNINLSQEELSNLFSSPRQNLNRVLKELDREGILTLQGGKITIKSAEPIRAKYGKLVHSLEPIIPFKNL